MSGASRIARVGVVAKPGLRGAAGTLIELSAWLDSRGVTAVFETDTAALAGLGSARHDVQPR